MLRASASGMVYAYCESCIMSSLQIRGREFKIKDLKISELNKGVCLGILFIKG